MRFHVRIIVRVASVILLFEGISMILPFIFACYYKEYSVATSFFCLSLLCVAAAETARRVITDRSFNILSREGYFTVIIAWLMVIAVGATPYYTSGLNYSFFDCLMESCAGWTTTGCTVMDYNILPKSLILWKVVSSWLGGMGIIVLTTSVFPYLGIGGQRMASNEIPGPELEKLTAHFGDTAKIIYSLYFFLTVLEFLLLLPTDMDIYFVLVNTLSSVSTAGIVDLSSAQSHFVITPYIKIVLACFSITSSVSFLSYFLIAKGKFKEALHNTEIRVFIRIFLIAGLLMSFFLYRSGVYTSYLPALGNGIVQSISFSTTTGFIVDNLSEWPTFCKVILVILPLIGGCSFSTSGGMKVIRFVVFIKLIKRGIYKRIHPRSIKPIMVQKKPISAGSASGIAAFLLLYFGLFIVASIIVSLDNYDMETCFSAVLACLTNNGTSFGLMTGSDFSIFSGPVKFVLAIVMLAGRLELYGVLILLAPSYWSAVRARR